MSNAQAALGSRARCGTAKEERDTFYELQST